MVKCFKNVCHSCGQHIKKNVNKKSDNNSYPPKNESLEMLELKYILAFRKKQMGNISDKESLTIGRAIRKISYERRKKILMENRLWN